MSEELDAERNCKNCRYYWGARRRPPCGGCSAYPKYDSWEPSFEALRRENARLREALVEAREYVYGVWSSLRGAVGDDNMVKPTLDRIDAAITELHGGKQA